VLQYGKKRVYIERRERETDSRYIQISWVLCALLARCFAISSTKSQFGQVYMQQFVLHDRYLPSHGRRWVLHGRGWVSYDRRLLSAWRVYTWMRTHAFVLVLSYICGLVALSDRTQSSFSIIFTLNNFVEMYWLLEAYILKYRYIRDLIYTVFGVCLVCLIRMQAHLAGISSWVWNDHHLREWPSS